MTNVYMYADETGNLDYDIAGGGSRYFGIGTATWHDEPAEHLWQAERMRFGHAEAGINHAAGYHAVNDTRATRREVYQVIASQRPRFDTTFLAKERAFSAVREKGPTYLYQLAWYMHFKEIAKQVARPGDVLYVAVATLGTAARKTAFRQAVENVCTQVTPRLCRVVTAQWDSGSCWGLQVADYGLWAVQRLIERDDDQYMEWIAPSLATKFFPWGNAS